MINNPLTREQALEWADALESGKFQQGHGELLTSMYDESANAWQNMYCCLGVLCEINSFKSVHVGWMSDDRMYDNLTDLRSVQFLPGSIQSYFADLNDGKKFSFKEIAADIRKKLIPAMFENSVRVQSVDHNLDPDGEVNEIAQLADVFQGDDIEIARCREALVTAGYCQTGGGAAHTFIITLPDVN